MRGFLEFLVLRMVSQRGISGEEIRQELEKRKGCKPSCGTVYPVLKCLKEKGLIREIADGKKIKKYTITKEGQKELKVAVKRFVALFYDMKEEFEKCC